MNRCMRIRFLVKKFSMLNTFEFIHDRCMRIRFLVKKFSMLNTFEFIHD